MPSGRAEAQPDVLVTEQDAKAVAAPPGAEYLPVSGAVAQEAYLGEHDRQERGHRQLPPRVAPRRRQPIRRRARIWWMLPCSHLRGRLNVCAAAGADPGRVCAIWKDLQRRYLPGCRPG
jgi:hypothetical protein